MRERIQAGLLCGLIALTLVVTAGAGKGATAFHFMGDFSNVRHTPEHAYGYRLQLWREGERLVGLFSDASGQAADTPVGLIEDVHFNPASGSLTFHAKLSVASVYAGKGKQEPTHDLFTFKGTVRDNEVRGILTHADRSRPGMRANIKGLQLQKTNTGAMVEASSYDEWKRAVDDILKVRGPKW